MPYLSLTVMLSAVIFVRRISMFGFQLIICVVGVGWMLIVAHDVGSKLGVTKICFFNRRLSRFYLDCHACYSVLVVNCWRTQHACGVCSFV
jgi:hypothetical protein